MASNWHSSDLGGPLPVQRAYDLAAPFYDAWNWQGFWREHEYPVVKAVLGRFSRGRRSSFSILDVGCGTGWYLHELRPLCREQVGIDVSAGMLAVARQRLPDATLIRASSTSIPFAEGRFDVVLCTRVLSHLRAVGPTIKEMRRVLVPGGMLVLADVDASHDYRFTRLPVAGGHVAADTFKHARASLLREVDLAGFIQDRVALIESDGTVTSERQESRSSAGAIAGWVASWRRASASAGL